jgi:hypothetical protein
LRAWIDEVIVPALAREYIQSVQHEDNLDPELAGSSGPTTELDEVTK